MTYKDKPYMCVSLKELPAMERPREKMVEKGSDSLSNLDLLCLLIGSGSQKLRVQDIADNVLSYICSRNIEDLNLTELETINGLGKAKAITILSAIELGRRLCSSSRNYFRTPKDVWETIKHFDDVRQEHFICVLLNGAYEIIDKLVITTGLINRTLVHPREVFAPAIEKRATAIIIAHNHPSGDLTPSPEDIEVTARIKRAGDVLGISVLDHIIFCSNDYKSLAESGEFFFQ